jgi:hypothetical protein
MMSDDARLALQLQEVEMRVARGVAAHPRKRGRTQHETIRMRALEPNPCSHDQQETSKGSPRTKNAKSNLPERLASSSEHADLSAGSGLQADLGASLSSKRNSTKAPKSLPPAQKSGWVSFHISPDDSSSALLPVKRSHMSLLEDKTIFDVKRLLVEGVRSSLSASQLEIRTSSGMLLGQDHSLRYGPSCGLLARASWCSSTASARTSSSDPSAPLSLPSVFPQLL